MSLPTEDVELRAAEPTQVKRVHRLKLNAAAWVLGTILLTTLWVLNEWQANGALESFGHEGNPGQWNPTLWALVVGIWGLIVGIMALRAYFERPMSESELDYEVARLNPTIASKDAAPEFRRSVRTRLERIQRLKFHVATWLLAMIVLTPIWALIEWQDNGGFEEFGNDSQPGVWEPWILYVGGIWALVIAVFGLWVFFHRPAKAAEIESEPTLESR